MTHRQSVEKAVFENKSVAPETRYGDTLDPGRHSSGSQPQTSERHVSTTPAATQNSQSLPSVYFLLPDRFDTRLDKSTWLEMARGLRRRGWNAFIASARKSPDATDYDGLVRYVPTLDIPNLFRWITLISLFLFLRRNARSNDVIIMNEDCLWLLPLLRAAGIEKVHLDIRTLPVKSPSFKRRLDHLLFWTLPLKLLGKRASSYSFITEPLRRVMSDTFAIGDGSHCIWQSGVNCSLFDASNSAASSSPAPAGRPFQLFYHGGLLLSRGLDTVIDALAHPDLPFEVFWTVLGDGKDRAELEAQVRARGLQDHVKFLGAVPYEEVPRYIAAADCCICPLPDIAEWRVSSPLKVMEYMASCKPMILTPLAAHRDVAADLSSVVWTAGYTARDFVAALVTARSELPALQSGTLNAREIVRTHYEWQVQADKLDEHLRHLLHSSNSRRSAVR